MALRFEDVDFDKGLIRVERSYDSLSHTGSVEPKSQAGRRTVPLISPSWRAQLAGAKLRSGRSSGPDLLRGRRAACSTLARSPPLSAGAGAQARVEILTLHECRHTFASLMIRAGVNVKALATYMGHAGIAIDIGSLRASATWKRGRGCRVARRLSRGGSAVRLYHTTFSEIADGIIESVLMTAAPSTAAGQTPKPDMASG